MSRFEVSLEAAQHMHAFHRSTCQCATLRYCDGYNLLTELAAGQRKSLGRPMQAFTCTCGDGRVSGAILPGGVGESFAPGQVLTVLADAC